MYRYIRNRIVQYSMNAKLEIHKADQNLVQTLQINQNVITIQQKKNAQFILVINHVNGMEFLVYLKIGVIVHIQLNYLQIKVIIQIIKFLIFHLIRNCSPTSYLNFFLFLMFLDYFNLKD
ncbi:unnamed protein product [Paramecium primaurelia]|uniref:Uncharacterized protein n=1 Tax=Paramecium primaurelia TaxID=5886 RepID=A0A8S1P797_PARPR|nr:unnamed protein product [Paramecium primaurelia]